MSSPWKTNVSEPTEPVNFQDVMLEEMTKHFQEKENRKYGVFAFSNHEEIEIPEGAAQQSNQLKSDEEFAKILQQQYNTGYCDILEKDQVNSASGVTYLNDKQFAMNFDGDSDNEELEDIRDKTEWDKLGEALKEHDPIPVYNCKCDNDGNLVRENNTVSTETIYKIMSFPWQYVPGASIEKKKVQKRKYWFSTIPEPKEESILFGIDGETKMLLYKMFKMQILKQILGLISVGEDALILQAKTNPKYPKGTLPTDCAVKVFKTTLGESKRKDKLIAEDHRFKGMWKRSGELDIVKTAFYWNKQEVQILQRLQKAGIPCPEIIIYRRNVLVMSYLNRENSNEPAPKLRDAFLDSRELISAYEQITHSMKVMFNECNLIHGDLSPTNILWYNNKCYIIDVSQFVRRTHEKALHLLYDDCERICNFFMSKDLSNIATSVELFIDITGYDPRNRFIWEKYQKSLKINSHADIKSDIQSA